MLWHVLASLGLAPADHAAAEYFLSDAGRAADFIARDGELLFPFDVAGRSYRAVIRPGPA